VQVIDPTMAQPRPPERELSDRQLADCHGAYYEGTNRQRAYRSSSDGDGALPPHAGTVRVAGASISDPVGAASDSPLMLHHGDHLHRGYRILGPAAWPS
jgi:hypothetical protein